METSVLTTKNNTSGEKAIDDEMMIEAVRNTTLLWKKSKSKMPVQIKDLWKKVCDDMKIPVEMLRIVQDRWSNLRARYMRARKTYLAYISSGSAAKKRLHSKANSSTLIKCLFWVMWLTFPSKYIVVL